MDRGELSLPLWSLVPRPHPPGEERGLVILFFNLVGKSPRNRIAKSAGHARKKPHLPICACVIRKKKNIEVTAIADAAGPEKQYIYLPRPY